MVLFNGKEDPDAGYANLPLDAEIVVFPDGSTVDLAEHFTKWKTKQDGQDIVFGSFRVTQDKLEIVRQAILSAGGELI